MEPSAIRGILFDKDGTLLDFHASWMPAIEAVAQTFAGCDPARYAALMDRGGWRADTGRVAAGTPFAAGNTRDIVEAWTDLLPPARLEDRDALIAEIDALFVAHCRPTPVCDLGALFDALSARGLRLGIATSDSAQGANASLSPFGLVARLDFIAGYDSGHGAKPGPGPVHAFCRTVGLAPSQVAVVGDNGHDIAMARAAGAGAAIGVATGTTDAETLAAEADAVYADIVAMARALFGVT